MTRDKTYHIQALNISLHDHSRDKYIDMFDKIFKEKKEIKIRGSMCMMPDKIIEKSNSENDYMVARLRKYTKIDKNKPWLDTKRNEPILDEEGNPKNIVPENNEPNLQNIIIVFNIKDHRLFFIEEEISAISIEKFFTETFKALKLYDALSITIEQSPDSIDKIIDLKYKTKLEISINIPNPDDIGGIDKQVEERLRKIGANKYNESYTSKNGTLNPDNEIIGIMKLATSNGNIKAVGRNELGKKIVLETRNEKPMSTIMKYNKKTEETSLIDILVVTCKNFMVEIKNKIKQP